MLTPLFVETFGVLERVILDNAHSRETWGWVRDIKGYFAPKVGKLLKSDTGGDIVIEGDIVTAEEVDLENRLRYKDVQYWIVQRKDMKNPVAGNVAFYSYSVAKGRLDNEEPIKIDQGVS